MSHFRLFSFECLNGVLGDESTNNRSIEVQLMTPFLKDNSHFQLLSSVHSAASDITSIFSCAVLDHAYSFASTRHLDIVPNLSTNSVVEDIVPATKYTISTLWSGNRHFIKCISQSFPCILDESKSFYLPRSYRRMHCVTIKVQKVKSRHYVWARNVFQFSNSSSPGIHTVLIDPDVRPAKNSSFCNSFHPIQWHWLC